MVVEPGAILQAPTTGESVGGKIALIGPTVDNEGTIETPDGQTILAAGLQVGFNAHAQTDPSLRGVDVFVGGVTDADGNTFGTVTNGGLIESPEADVTMAGRDIEQNGVINSQTSVALNGRIDLLADYDIDLTVTSPNGANETTFNSISTGTVNLGPDSVMQILPDTSANTVVGTSLALSSLVNIEALDINMASGAELLAPGAMATPPTFDESTPPVELTIGSVDLTGAGLTAGVNLDAGTWSTTGVPVLSPSSGSVNINSGATIDVSGSQNVSASVSDDIIAVQLRGTELANSPLQQDGPLRGQTVYVDIRQAGVYNGVAWIGSPIGDLSGYAGLVPHTATELTDNGGTVNIQAGTNVNIASDATINVSGGSIDFQAATISTTKVVTANGRIIDISQATPDQLYEGLYDAYTVTSPKWGVTQTYGDSLVTTSTYDPGYVQGGNAGAVTISSPAVTLNGSLFANTVAGVNQVASTKLTSALNATFLNPSGNSQELGLSQFANATFLGSDFLPILDAIKGVPTSGALILNLFPAAAGATNPQDVVFQSTTGPVVADPFASSGNPVLNLSADLVNADGFGHLTIDGNAPSASPSAAHFNAVDNLEGAIIPINTDGNIAVPAGVDLTMESGGAITLASVNIDIESSISAPGGTISFTTQNLVGSQASSATSPLESVDGRGDFTLRDDALLSTAGLIVDNASGAPGANTLPQFTDGGSITIKGFNVDLQAGTSIDSSGGVLVAPNGKATYGAGGKVDIEAGQDPYTDPTKSYAIVGGELTLGATLSAYSGAKGGSLSILAPSIQVGGSTLENGDTSSTPISQESALAWGNGTTLWLDHAGSPDFFSQGGFGSFSLTGLGLAPVVYANGMAQTVDPFASTPGIVLGANLTLSPVAQSYLATPGVNGIGLTPTTYSLASQRTPVSLAFNASGVTGGSNVGSTIVVRGDLVMDQTATIETDPLASVTLKGQSAAVLGKVFVPGGAITVSGAGDSTNLFAVSNPVATVDLGPDSVLSAAGTVETTFNALGYTTGNVLNGGSITVSGNIVAESGSMLDVSGTSGTLDVTPAAAGLSGVGFTPQQLVPLHESSNGGSILLGGTMTNGALANIGEVLSIDSTMVGVGGPGAEGGSLTVSNGFFAPEPNSQTQFDASLVVTSSGLVRSSGLTGLGVIGQGVTPADPLTDVDGNPITGYFAAGSNLFVNQPVDPSRTNNGGVAGGFSSLTLDATVQFSGPVSIATSKSLIIANNPAFSNSFSVTSGGVIYADSTVNLSSAYVRLGLPFSGPGGTTSFTEPTLGANPGTLSVNATELIDVGNLVLENINSLSLSTPGGDVRGDGTLNITGNVSIDAAQVYPVTESTFAIAAFAPQGGSSLVTIANSSGVLPALPLSAGGVLDIYADTIDQGGVLRAPLGTIDLGSLAPPTGSGFVLPTTGTVTLAAGSTTSVSADGATIPYGSIDNSGNWDDPAGNPLTAGSDPTLPAKSINLSAATINIASDAGTGTSESTLDISGGGDLFAAQFISGTGGTKDILASTNSFAIFPTSSQSPYAPYDVVPGYATSGYSNLQVGDQVYLSASNGLAAGVYTLLPARYALLPGAFLVTPKSAAPVSTSTIQLDGSSLVTGYRLNSLDSTREQTTDTLFEVASQGVVEARADYAVSSANAFFPQSAAALGTSTPRLPVDAGQLVLNATDALTLSGASRTLASLAAAGGLGSIVDIATAAEINIGTTTVVGDLNLDPASLTGLNAGSLLIGGFRNSAGNTATVTTNSITVNNQGGAALTADDLILVSNGSLQVQAGSTIEASPGGTVAAQPLAIINGNSAAPGSDGALLRVSDSATDATTRPDAINLTDTSPQLTIGQHVTLTGASLVLDSTGSADSIDPSAVLTATDTASISSGQISLDLDNNTSAAGLVLSGAALANLQNSALALSLLSYSSLDIYGSGSIGASAVAGQFQVQSLALHAAEIRGFDNAGQQVTINAQNVLLDNSAGKTAPGPLQAPAAGSTLAINAGTITLGVNPLAIDQYAQVALTASSAIVLGNGTGSLSTAGGLSLATPLLTAAPVVPLTPNQEVTGQATPASATTQTISAAGALKLSGTGAATPILAEGLGANVTLAGTSVEADGEIQLPSGTLALVATTGDVTVGGSLNVGGTEATIYSATEYTSGGQVSLTSYAGGVTLNSGSTINVSAQPGGASAGGIVISAPTGTFSFAGSNILGQGGVGGEGGSFSLDVDSLASGNLSPLEQALNPVVTGAIAGDTYLGGFTEAQTIRVRTGDITVDGTTATNAFNLSADAGSIIVSGEIAANSGPGGASSASIDVTKTNSSGAIVLANSGITGGSISLEANGSVTLLGGSLLSVAAQNINDAGQGGSVTLEAGAETNGHEISSASGRDAVTQQFSGVPVIDIQSGSVIDLSVAATDKTFDGSLIQGASGTLHLRAPQTLNNADVQIDPILGNLINPSSIVVEGYQVFDASTDGSIDNREAAVMANGIAFASTAGQPATASYTAMLNALISSSGANGAWQGLTTIEPGAEIVNTNLDTAANPGAGDLTLANDWDLSTFRFGPNSAAGDLTLRAGGNIVLDFGASLSDGFTANPVPSLAAYGLWSDVLMSSGSQSWSYRIVSGADLSAADYHQVLPALQTNALVASSPSALIGGGGSVLIGANTPTNNITSLTTAEIMSSISSGGLGYFQTIRTGTGEINIASGGDVQLLNNVATIYSAGTQVPLAVETGTVSVESNPNDPDYPGPGNTVLIAPATLPDGFEVGSSFLGSTIESIAGNVITLTGNADANVSTITPEAFGGNGSTGVVDVSSSNVGSSTVTLTTQPPGLTPGASLLGSTILSITGQTVTLAGVVDAPVTFTNEGFTYSTPQAGFDVPVLSNPRVGSSTTSNSNYNFALNTNTEAQYSQNGGNVTISAQGSIAHYSDATGTLADDSSQELPTNWLLRRGYEVGGAFANNGGKTPEIASTTWWVDFNNFFEGVGALGGGDVTLTAGQNISNVDAVVPTNATMAAKDSNGNLIAPSTANLVENGGGDLVIRAGDNISGGVYYVERGQGTLEAGGQIMTNATRTVVTSTSGAKDPSPYLPTTLFLGKGSYNVSADGSLLLGPVVNPFLLPQGINNTVYDKSYFSTYAPTDSVTATSLSGEVTIKEGSVADSLLIDFYNDQVSVGTRPTDFARLEPWLGLIEATPSDFVTQADLLPPTIDAVAFSGDINLQGNLTLSPSPTGNLSLVAGGSVNAFQPIGLADDGVTAYWGSSQIDLSDVDPSLINGVATPLSYTGTINALAVSNLTLFSSLDGLFNVSGSTTGNNTLLSTEQQLHADLPLDPSDPNSATGPLHANDTTPVQVYAATGDIDGLALFSGKFVDAIAGNDITNIALYLQNDHSSDITLVQAGRDIIAYDQNSLLRQEAHNTGGLYLFEQHDPTVASDNAPDGLQAGGPNTGDIQIAGPGTLEVLAGRNLTLGGLEDAANKVDGTGYGIVSIGNTLNPALPFDGADVVAAAGIGGSGDTTLNEGLSGFGLDSTHNSLLNFPGFEDLFLNPNSGGTEAALYLPVLGNQLGLTDATDAQIWSAFKALPVENQDALATTIFYDVLRDAGRDHNNPSSPNFGAYTEGYAALNALFPPSNTYQGDISLTAREIKTTNVGDISLLAPGGGVDVGINNNGSQAVDQGILTVSGGSISIFADQSVAVGTSRIFTLHGGDEIIWSTHGNIAAGASSKTVQSAPPTRVLIDPTSGNVQNDLAGLATGGGIGVLETVVGAPPGNVDLIAPSGIVDAGDAGIRSSGNINIAATAIVNAGNIQSGGSTSGVAATPTPNIGATVAASSAAGSSQGAVNEAARQQQPNQSQEQDLPSIISVEVIGHSADDSDSVDAASPPSNHLLARDNAR